MTQPFDPLNPPNVGLGMRAGMFGDSAQCPNPRCGFATSDPNVYECPSCQTVWRKRPQAATAPSGPAVGAPIALVCALCGEGFGADKPPVFDGNGLSHAGCLAAQQTAPYLKMVQDVEPPKPKRKRRRKRRRPSRPIQTVSNDASEAL